LDLLYYVRDALEPGWMIGQKGEPWQKYTP
jgi:hypothetical protein